jgi:hypothetical protein
MVLFKTSEITTLYNEAHTANTIGPITAGWSNSGATQIKSFNLETAANRGLPASASGAVLFIETSVRFGIADAAGTLYSMGHFAANANPTYQGVFANANIDLIQTAVGALTRLSISRFFVVPFDTLSGSKTLKATAQWPNVNQVLPSTFVRCSLYGYLV